MSSSRKLRGWITSGIAISSMSLSIFQQTPIIRHLTEFWDSTFDFWKEPTLISDICPKSRKGEWPCPVQSLSHVALFATSWMAARQASLSTTNSQSLLKSMCIELVRPSNHLILCRPLLLLPSIFPSSRVFANESALHIRWPKYWSFCFSISPPNEHPGLMSFRVDWLHLLAVQGTLKSLLQHHNSKASILLRSTFFIV